MDQNETDTDLLTYEKLAAEITKLSPEQKKQMVQIMISGPDGDKPTALQPGVCLDTVHNLCCVAVEDGEPFKDEEITKTRDAIDGSFKPESVVIMGDISGYERGSNNDSLEFRREYIKVAKRLNAIIKEAQEIGEDEDGQDRLMDFFIKISQKTELETWKGSGEPI